MPNIWRHTLWQIDSQVWLWTSIVQSKLHAFRVPPSLFQNARSYIGSNFCAEFKPWFGVLPYGCLGWMYTNTANSKRNRFAPLPPTGARDVSPFFSQGNVQSPKCVNNNYSHFLLCCFDNSSQNFCPWVTVLRANPMRNCSAGTWIANEHMVETIWICCWKELRNGWWPNQYDSQVIQEMLRPCLNSVQPLSVTFALQGHQRRFSTSSCAWSWLSLGLGRDSQHLLYTQRF